MRITEELGTPLDNHTCQTRIANEQKDQVQVLMVKCKMCECHNLLYKPHNN